MANNPFLDEKFPSCVRFGSYWEEDYNVEITMTQSGQEHRRLVHQAPVRRTTVFFNKDRGDLYNDIVKFFHKAFGKFKGFRVESYDDYSTNGSVGEPTMLDQKARYISAGLYQLEKTYAVNGGVRTIFCPRVGTIKVAVNGISRTAGVSLDTTTGRLTLAPAPNTNDSVTFGCLYDIPCRFDSSLAINPVTQTHADTNQLELVELINP